LGEKVKSFIPFDQLRIGSVYCIESRNLVVGVFTGRGFIGIRTQYNEKSLFEEYECSVSQDFGTARATRCLGAISEGVQISEILDGSVCGGCGGEAVYDKHEEDGGKGWTHTVDGSPLCGPGFAVAVPNAPLFTELERYEKQA